MRRLFAGALLLSASLFSASSASAATVLTFEGVGDQAAVGDFYNGGTDSKGNAGTDYGVQFSGNSLGLINESAGGNGRTANEPSGVTLFFFDTGSVATLNVAAGFSHALSLYYAGMDTTTVTIYDGLNGAGNVLGTLILSPNLTDIPYDAWSRAGVSFTGVARSVSFSGKAGHMGFDSIALGALPEASTWAMMILGVGLAGTAVRRRKVQAGYAA